MTSLQHTPFGTSRAQNWRYRRTGSAQTVTTNERIAKTAISQTRHASPDQIEKRWSAGKKNSVFKKNGRQNDEYPALKPEKIQDQIAHRETCGTRQGNQKTFDLKKNPAQTRVHRTSDPQPEGGNADHENRTERPQKQNASRFQEAEDTRPQDNDPEPQNQNSSRFQKIAKQERKCRSPGSKVKGHGADRNSETAG
jgi:hypothetical protein